MTVSDWLNSGIMQIFVCVSLASVAIITWRTGSLVLAVGVSGWVGLFASVLVNELTPGYYLHGIPIAEQRGRR